MLNYALTAVALAAVLGAHAFAQQSAERPNNLIQSSMSLRSASGHGNFVLSQRSTDWRGSKLIGSTVYGPENASIGNVNDVLVANDGKINAVVIGVGGFLGVGEKDVAVSFDALNITRMPNSNSIDKITVSYSKDELKNAPNFVYYELTKLQTTGSGVTDKIKSLNPMKDDWKK